MVSFGSSVALVIVVVIAACLTKPEKLLFHSCSSSPSSKFLFVPDNITRVLDFKDCGLGRDRESLFNPSLVSLGENRYLVSWRGFSRKVVFWAFNTQQNEDVITKSDEKLVAACDKTKDSMKCVENCHWHRSEAKTLGYQWRGGELHVGWWYSMYHFFVKWTGLSALYRCSDPEVSFTFPCKNDDGRTVPECEPNPAYNIGNDATFFAVVTIDPNSFACTNPSNIGVVETGKTSVSLLGVDTRILEIEKNLFLLSYNTHTSRAGSKQALRVAQLVGSNLELFPEQWLFFEQPLTKNFVFSVEQNNWFRFSPDSWSTANPVHRLWLNRTSNTFQCDDLVSPFTAFLNCSVEHANNDGLQKRFSEVLPGGAFAVAGSTPAIPLLGHKDVLIEIMHAKYLYRNVSASAFPELSLYTNCTSLQPNHHPERNYFFVLVTRSKRHQLLRYSDLLFLQVGEETGLVQFPVGLTYSPQGRLLMSYGHDDAIARIADLGRSERVEDLLAHTHSTNASSSSSRIRIRVLHLKNNRDKA